MSAKQKESERDREYSFFSFLQKTTYLPLDKNAFTSIYFDELEMIAMILSLQGFSKQDSGSYLRGILF